MNACGLLLGKGGHIEPVRKCAQYKEDVTLSFLPIKLEGIVDEPNLSYKQEVKRPLKISSHKGNRDEHDSFPKGLVTGMLLRNVRD